ncbi:MAG: hypothetical protein HOQ24_04675 [Mycobacteriaceae bacterium]|nr:hypothetical protein [Mycobacteriaceae bacterium]
MARKPVARIGLSAFAAVGLLLAGCGGNSGHEDGDHTGMHHDMAGMPGGDGLSAEASGLRFVPATETLPAGQPSEFRYAITGSDGKPVTSFEPDQTKLMHFYLVRSDLTGFQHIHPTMAADGTWSARLTPLQPGSYRAYASFTPAATDAMPLVLSKQVIVPGEAALTALPVPAGTAAADGYTLTLSTDRFASGTEQRFTVAVSRDGKPVNTLQPYLGTYAHLTAFRAGDLAFAHLHPHDDVRGDSGGPTLNFEAMLPAPGTWRLFLQFQTDGVLHTAATTVTVTG